MYSEIILAPWTWFSLYIVCSFDFYIRPNDDNELTTELIIGAINITIPVKIQSTIPAAIFANDIQAAKMARKNNPIKKFANAGVNWNKTNKLFDGPTSPNKEKTTVIETYEAITTYATKIRIINV
jgi:hypothetical protein